MPFSGEIRSADTETMLRAGLCPPIGMTMPVFFFASFRRRWSILSGQVELTQAQGSNITATLRGIRDEML